MTSFTVTLSNLPLTAPYRTTIPTTTIKTTLRVKFRTSKIYFVIMSSVFNTEKHIDVKFDLKGSLAGRRTSEKACKLGAVQKDLNLMESGELVYFWSKVLCIV